MLALDLTELIPDPEVLIALEPDELGLRILPILGQWPRHEQMQLSTLLIMANGHPQLPGQAPVAGGIYPREYKTEIDEALREAWAWLEGSALLIPHPDYNHSIVRLSRRARKLANEVDVLKAYSPRRLPKRHFTSVHTGGCLGALSSRKI